MGARGPPLGGGCRLSPISWIGSLVMPPALSPSDVYQIDKKDKVFFPVPAHEILMLDPSVPLFALLCGDDVGASHSLGAVLSDKYNVSHRCDL